MNMEKTFENAFKSASNKVIETNWFYWFIAILILMLGMIWAKYQWTECREMGMSIFYCLQHIG